MPSLCLCAFLPSFDGDKISGNAGFCPLSVLSVTFHQGLPKAMYFTLGGKGVSVYTLRPKDNFLVCLRHSLDHFRADRAYNFAVCHTSEIGNKDILESVFFIPHATDDVLIQNIGHKIRFQPAGTDYLFVVLADVFEHIFNAVGDFIGIIDRRKSLRPNRSPVTSGFLSGKVTPQTKFEGDDVLKFIPQLSKENIQANAPVLEVVKELAQSKGATPAQISLA